MLTINNYTTPVLGYISNPQTESIVAYFGLCAVLAGLLATLPAVLGPSLRAVDKNTAYECGFEPFIETKTQQTESHFVIVAILFVVFDLEIVMLVPFATSIVNSGTLGFLTVYTFALLLVIGLYYEWVRGALSWPVWFVRNT